MYLRNVGPTQSNHQRTELKLTVNMDSLQALKLVQRELLRTSISQRHRAHLVVISAPCKVKALLASQLHALGRNVITKSS
jgi:hypothetical protein